VAADLGITAESLRTRVRKDEAQAAPQDRDGRGNAAEELARLRAENARLLKAEQEWQLEREIVRRARAGPRRAPGREKQTVSEIRAIHAEHQGHMGLRTSMLNRAREDGGSTASASPG
jgi:transposase